MNAIDEMIDAVQRRYRPSSADLGYVIFLVVLQPFVWVALGIAIGMALAG